MGQVLDGFPDVIAFTVAFPANEVLELALEHATANDYINFFIFLCLKPWQIQKVVAH